MVSEMCRLLEKLSFYYREKMYVHYVHTIDDPANAFSDKRAIDYGSKKSAAKFLCHTLPCQVTLIILMGVAIWNDYQFSVFFLQNPDIQTVPVALSGFFSQFQNNISWVVAGCLTSILPAVLVYLFLQRYFVKGYTDGIAK
jgi:ABC-type maltose transport system permease subunit